MKVLITLGPTQEPIDDVRFMTNASSGRMGAALAEEGLRRGHEVTLVCGPVNIKLPSKAKAFRVRTAAEMTERTLALLKKQDVLISTAAIADYTPVKKFAGKIKSEGKPIIKLKPTRKLIKEARKRYPKLFIVGFKAEFGVGREKLIESAKKKLAENKLDLIVANDLQDKIFDSEKTNAFIIDGKRVQPTGRTSKRNAARGVWDRIEGKLTTWTAAGPSASSSKNSRRRQDCSR